MILNPRGKLSGDHQLHSFFRSRLGFANLKKKTLSKSFVVTIGFVFLRFNYVIYKFHKYSTNTFTTTFLGNCSSCYKNWMLSFLFLLTKQLLFPLNATASFSNSSNVPLFNIIYSFKNKLTSQVLFKVISDHCNLNCFFLKRSQMIFQKQRKIVNPKLLILFNCSLAVALVSLLGRSTCF